MKANHLKMEQIYVYTSGQDTLYVMYYGMKEDRYLFIPYDVKKKHYNGIPNTLCEKEVINLIKPMV